MASPGQSEQEDSLRLCPTEQKECPPNVYLNGAEAAAFAYGRISVNAYNSKEELNIIISKYHSDCCTGDH